MQEFWNTVGLGDIFPITLEGKNLTIVILVMLLIGLSLIMIKEDNGRRR